MYIYKVIYYYFNIYLKFILQINYSFNLLFDYLCIIYIWFVHELYKIYIIFFQMLSKGEKNSYVKRGFLEGGAKISF
jgi:hypothetical protein